MPGSLHVATVEPISHCSVASVATTRRWADIDPARQAAAPAADGLHGPARSVDMVRTVRQSLPPSAGTQPAARWAGRGGASAASVGGGGRVTGGLLLLPAVGLYLSLVRPPAGAASNRSSPSRGRTS
jgi:hypothetical protein